MDDCACCVMCAYHRPGGGRKWRDRIWVCPACNKAWVCRRESSWGETFWTWAEWPSPGPEPGAPAPMPPIEPASDAETAEAYLAGILSGFPPWQDEHPLDRIPDARVVLRALADLGYQIVRVPR